MNNEHEERICVRSEHNLGAPEEFAQMLHYNQYLHHHDKTNIFIVSCRRYDNKDGKVKLNTPASAADDGDAGECKGKDDEERQLRVHLIFSEYIKRHPAK